MGGGKSAMLCLHKRAVRWMRDDALWLIGCSARRRSISLWTRRSSWVHKAKACGRVDCWSLWCSQNPKQPREAPTPPADVTSISVHRQDVGQSLSDRRAERRCRSRGVVEVVSPEVDGWGRLVAEGFWGLSCSKLLKGNWQGLRYVFDSHA